MVGTLVLIAVASAAVVGFRSGANDIASTFCAPDGEAVSVLDGPTFFDHTHTNERGARLVAERIHAEVAVGPVMAGRAAAVRDQAGGRRRR